MRRVPVLLALVMTVAACGAPSDAGGVDDNRPLTDPSADDRFERSQVTLRGPEGDRVTVPVHVADEPRLRRLGLMHRDGLAPGAGMVFVFPHDTRGGFWMKNTRIPLSIAYFGADGAVLAVLDMQPCELDPCPSYDPGVAYRGALEVNQGFFEDLGVDDGWFVELAAGVEAVR